MPPGRERRRRACESVLPRMVFPETSRCPQTGERSQAFWPLEGRREDLGTALGSKNQGAMRLLGGSGIVGDLGSFRASGFPCDRSESVLRSRCHADNAWVIESARRGR